MWIHNDELDGQILYTLAAATSTPMKLLSLQAGGRPIADSPNASILATMEYPIELCTAKGNFLDDEIIFEPSPFHSCIQTLETARHGSNEVRIRMAKTPGKSFLTRVAGGALRAAARTVLEANSVQDFLLLI